MQLTRVEQPNGAPNTALVLTAFILGGFLLVAALFLQINTYKPGTEIVPGIVALALSIDAAVFFFHVWRWGSRVAQAFALLCGVVALFNISNLLWWVVTTLCR